MAGERRRLLTHYWELISQRWLYLGEDIILVAVALVLLGAGFFIAVDAVGSLVNAIATNTRAQVIFGVAESALLALILAELVHSLQMSLNGHGLSPEPFLVIAIIAILRKMLLTTVQISNTPEMQTTILVVGELVALAVVILILTIALALILRHRRPTTEGQS